MAREKKGEISLIQEDSILDKIEMKESIYDDASYQEPAGKMEEKKVNNKSSIETE